VIEGVVTSDGVPVIDWNIGDEIVQAVLDTGFNGDLELPTAMFDKLSPRFVGRVRSYLAGGQSIDEDAYLVELLFDGVAMRAEATFVSGMEALIGTHFLRNHRLEIDFVDRTVMLFLAE
jgi:predicted aspartyl protease